VGKEVENHVSAGARFTVYDILSWLASTMTTDKIPEVYPELLIEDIFKVLSFSAERRIKHLSGSSMKLLFDQNISHLPF